ncbi:chitin deacetylase 7 [Aplysia californica]|uniref:Chitin deacetylase 7 n=1 Tax=Aplysia californica TaxID=6500 RepID=A0ABM1A9V9_APLCA|nr:chitin deacetylase 7 [Aplysia californica]
MWRQTSLLLLVLLLSANQCVNCQCVPGDTCKAPDCRCWDDPSIPGGLTAAETPQVVLISFEYTVNKGNVDLYTKLLKGVTNPNGCQATATFFVQEVNTDFSVVKTLYDEGHEIGMTSSDGIIPSDAAEWLATFQLMKTKITDVFVPEDQVVGSRAPELSVGGDDQFAAIEQVGLSYDSSCSSSEYAYRDNMLWPYTYDYIYRTPKCTIGRAPESAHKGKWQFLVANLRYNEQNCATLSACSPFIKSSQDAFDMLFESFSNHYEGSKSPFVLYIDPLWLSVDYQYEGTRQFVEFVRSGFGDTWFLTTQQSLAWIKEPVTSDKAIDFKSWGCS